MFAYCENNPVISSDSTGRACIIVNKPSNRNGNSYTDTGTSIYGITYGPYAKAANCYAYALHLEVDPRTGRYFDEKPQPGEFSGSEWCSGLSSTQNIPAELVERWIIHSVMADGKELGFTIQKVDSANYLTSNNQWLVALAYSPQGDYHWYRRDLDGKWSHKPGLDAIQYTDGSNRTIYDPRTSNRVYKDCHYSVFLGYYVITVTPEG